MDREEDEEEQEPFLNEDEMELGKEQEQEQDFARPQSPESQVSRKESAIPPALSYCASSIMMTVANKYILSYPEFNLNFFLLAIQSIVCVLAISACKAGGLITYRDLEMNLARKWFSISLALIAMIYTGTRALRNLSIPVYTIFKNLTIILIAYGEVQWFGGSVPSMALFSFALMIFSSIIAAWADVKHALESHGAATKLATLNAGYIWMMLNCLATASYTLYMRKRIKLFNFKDFDTMYYSNVLIIPVLVIASLLVEDWSAANLAKAFPRDHRNSIVAAIIFSGGASILISYCSVWCLRVTSSTTYSMVGFLNKLPIAVSGLVLFDAPVTIPSISAIAMGFTSGIVYAVAKSNEEKKKNPEPDVLPTSVPMTAIGQSNRDGLRS